MLEDNDSLQYFFFYNQQIIFKDSMSEIIYVLIAALAGVAVGGLITWFILNNVLKSKRDSILSEAEKEGETLKEKKILQAKEKFLELKNQHENEVREKNKKLQQSEDRAKSKEREVAQQIEQYKRKEKELQTQKDSLTKQTEVNQRKASELEKNNQKAISLLEEMAKMSADQAKSQLMEQLKKMRAILQLLKSRTLWMKLNSKRIRKQRKSSSRPFSAPLWSML
jgi:ribonuclease Y